MPTECPAARRLLGALAMAAAVLPSVVTAEANLPPPVPGTAADAVPGWPARGELEYDVLYGRASVRIGSAVHRWSHESGRYQMQSTALARGLLAAIDSLSYTQRSRGAVLAEGLRPDLYEVERGGRRREWSEFDWARGTVTLYRDGKPRQAEIARGDQDVLSLWHQIAIARAWREDFELTVVTGKSAAPSRVSLLGEETVEVPAGRFVARRLKAVALDGSLAIDLWLARDGQAIPLRIRMVDRKGELLDQQLRRGQLDGASGIMNFGGGGR